MNTYYAAICEDQKPSLEYIQKQLNALFELHKLNVETDSFLSGDELLKNMKQKDRYDILFVDIEMPGKNGIETAKELRKSFPELLIIFISNREDQVFASFEVQPFRFIRKSHFNEEVPVMINALVSELRQRDAVLVPVKELHSGAVYNLNINHIIYVEVIGRNCSVTTTETAFEFRYKLKDLQELLAPYGFLQPHRSFLVNFKYIDQIRKDTVLLTTGSSIPLSRGNRDGFEREFFSIIRRTT